MIKEDIRLQSKKAQWEIIFVFVIFALLFYFMANNKQDDYAKSFKGETIGLLTRMKSSDEHGYTLQYYFYLNKKVISRISVENYNPTDLKKFYKIKYDLNNPEKNYIVLEEELEPDSLALVKAGFTKTKYYFYDAGVTCKYIEKEKWK